MLLKPSLCSAAEDGILIPACRGGWEASEREGSSMEERLPSEHGGNEAMSASWSLESPSDAV